jgi:hypothetical protein
LLVLVPLLLVVLLVGAFAAQEGYLGELAARVSDRGAEAQLADLRDVGQLRAAFEDSAGKPRLILLLSPT